MLTEYPDLRAYFGQSEELVFRKDFHSTQGGSDKVYILGVTKDHSVMNKNYRAFGLNGARGKGLTVQNKGSYDNLTDATNAIAPIMKEKERKGYTNMGSMNYASSSMSTSNGLEPIISVNRFKPGLFQEKDWVKDRFFIENALVSDSMIIEPYQIQRGNEPAWYYVQVNQSSTLTKQGIHMFAPNGAYDGTYEKTSPSTYHSSNIFVGYTINGHMALIDMYQLGNNRQIKDISDRMWKERRAMLTAAYEEMYPNRDPYDMNAFMYLNDYIYEDKLEYVKKHPGTYIARHINSTHTGKPMIFTVQ